MAGLKAVCFDCVDAAAQARWWADVLGARVRDYGPEDLADLQARGFAGPDDDPYVAVDPVDGDGPVLWFNRVPETKRGKNRVHLDVYGDVEVLVAKGATIVEPRPGWTVMADPEGNEFCVFGAADG